jgi:hypothetical protein
MIIIIDYACSAYYKKQWNEYLEAHKTAVIAHHESKVYKKREGGDIELT